MLVQSRSDGVKACRCLGTLSVGLSRNWIGRRNSAVATKHTARVCNTCVGFDTCKSFRFTIQVAFACSERIKGIECKIYNFDFIYKGQGITSVIDR